MKRKLAVILSALVITSAMFTGCGCENRTATADEAPTTISTETKPQSSNVSDDLTDTDVSNEEKSAVEEAGLKVDSKGNITDKDGNKVEVKDGKVEIKDENGKTVEVSVDTVKTVNDNTASANKTSGSTNTSKKPSSSSSTTSKPNSSSSSSLGSSSKPSNSSNNSASSSNKTWHEAVYKTVNHPAETEKVWVVDKEAYTYEEPVYEDKVRTICNDCGADITGNAVAHMKNHILNDPNCKGSYRAEMREIQVGTKTVEVPEQGHWETKVIKEAWTEKVLVKEAGYY